MHLVGGIITSAISGKPFSIVNARRENNFLNGERRKNKGTFTPAQRASNLLKVPVGQRNGKMPHPL